MARRPSFLSPDRRRSRRGVRAAVLAGTAVAACIGASLAFAGFNSAVTGGPMSVTSKRIFPGPRVASAWDLRDASSGAEANSSDPLSYADGLVQTPSTAIASGTNRYLEYTFSSARPLDGEARRLDRLAGSGRRSEARLADRLAAQSVAAAADRLRGSAAVRAHRALAYLAGTRPRRAGGACGWTVDRRSSHLIAGVQVAGCEWRFSSAPRWRLASVPLSRSQASTQRPAAGRCP